MPRFFTDHITDDRLVITGEDAKHISKVLRLKQGDMLTACDMAGFDYHAEIQELTADAVTAVITEKLPSHTEPTVYFTLYQALPKGDKLEFIVQKAVELGVSSIVPVMTRRCVSRPDSKSMEKKIQRLQKIAFEAAKQSGRGMIPQIAPLMDYKEAISAMAADERAMLFYENATDDLKGVLTDAPASVSLMIGAEGGFDEGEIDFAKGKNIPVLSLGKRILRCETAPLCALSILLYETGNI